MKHVMFTVEGTGSFPLDMLRYDRCWPSRSTDVNNMDWTDNPETRMVMLTSAQVPTKARWASFNWPMSSMRTV